MKKTIFIFIVILPLFVFSQAPDVILFNGNIYTGESNAKFCSALTIRNGLIAQIGSDTLLKLKDIHARVIDLDGKFCMPGLIEGHGHMQGLGKSLSSLNLLETKSWNEILYSVKGNLPELPG